MKMPPVKKCSALECSYNTNEICHALAITVGDVSEARCDTYWPEEFKAGDPEQTGSVGACRAKHCVFNKSLECTADGVLVNRHGSLAFCDTFRPR